MQIIMVDNSPDKKKSANFAKEYLALPAFKYIFEPRPGLSNARNIGVRAARANIVAFIDDDAIAAPGWALGIVDAYNSSDAGVGIVGGPVALRWPDKQPKWLSHKLLGYLGNCDLGNNLREVEEYEQLVGCNISYDRKSLLTIGGFQVELGRKGDTHNLLSNEELDASRRIKALGKKAIYAPTAFVEHVVDPSRVTQRWFRRRAAWQAISDVLSRPHDVPELISASTRRLGRLSKLRRKSECIGFFREKSTAIGFKQDVDLIYDLVILALAGGAADARAAAKTSGLLARLFGTKKTQL